MPLQYGRSPRTNLSDCYGSNQTAGAIRGLMAGKRHRQHVMAQQRQ